MHLDKKDVSMCTVKELTRFWSEYTVRMTERDEGQNPLLDSFNKVL